jgi:tetrapyrrole methylase family protein/MazG family protein
MRHCRVAHMDERSGGAAAGERFERFCELIARLRGPGGCPWDREQTHDSLKAMTIEEAYEVLEAIDHGDEELASELGDLLLQVVFHSQIAAEGARFTIADVIDKVSDKMVRRHPHVFAGHDADTPAKVLRTWEAMKQQERRAKPRAEASAGEPHEHESVLDGVSKSLPAVLEAFQVTTKAGRLGVDWPDAAAVLSKLDEETGELKRALAELPLDRQGRDGRQGEEARRVSDEIGDLLFATINLARKLELDPESALKSANRKFRRRFRHVEERLRERGRSPAESTLEEMDALWDEAKAAEREPA